MQCKPPMWLSSFSVGEEGPPGAGPPGGWVPALPAQCLLPASMFGWTSPGPHTINTNLQGPESQMTIYCVLQRLK